jgi:hypothetical protein
MKIHKLKDLPIGSKWQVANSPIEGILLEVCNGSADVIITKARKDHSGDNTISVGRLRIANETEVTKRG